MASVTSRPIKSARASGPSGWPMPSLTALSTTATSPRPAFVRADGLNDVGDQQAVDDEARAVGRSDGGLAQVRAHLARHGQRLVAGVQPAHQLQQPHHRHRVEEVHAQHFVGPAGGQPRSRLMLNDEVLLARMASGRSTSSRLRKMLCLRSRSSATHSITRSDAASSARWAVPRRRRRAASASLASSLPRLTIRSSELAPGPAGRPDVLVASVDNDVVAGQHADLGDACAHLPTADDADGLDDHGCLRWRYRRFRKSPVAAAGDFRNLTTLLQVARRDQFIQRLAQGAGAVLQQSFFLVVQRRRQD